MPNNNAFHSNWLPRPGGVARYWDDPVCLCVSVCLCVRPMKTSMRSISVIYTATFLQPLLILSQRSQEPYSTMVERWQHTRHTNCMSCWRYFVLCMSVNLPTRHVGGVKWYVVHKTTRHKIPPTRHTILHLQHVLLEVYRHTQHKTPPTRHTIGVSCM